MKALLLLLLLSFAAVSTTQAQSTPTAAPDKSKEVLLVDAACGQCRLGLPGKSCDLAIRMNGKAYFVDGTDIDSHGDAHAKDGFCNSVRKAQVQGEVVDNRFKATYFQLLPETVTAK
ncbi:DUF6370 family protein [Hymenobacter wooponensis]|uniref:Glutaminyl-tRNA synthetase n=1 Tax=Hymenobacter wooponensis TaxID=1525360 RepID=A0A4Z0MKD3_9BACT|nr:DUF6370 family protein [Hymenobacter wooponensis]TGD79830.1 hypothetical protein EU557_16600 [Hymenobacter wooponensis]